MRKAKKLSLTLMASVMALGVIAFTAQPANASYGYKYTDSIRPPVLTPTPSTGRAPVEPVATTVTPAPAAKTTTTVEPTKAAGSVTTLILQIIQIKQHKIFLALCFPCCKTCLTLYLNNRG